MEHSPVQKLPAYLRCTFQQSEAVRIDQLQRQYFSKLSGTSRILPVNTNLEFALSVARNSEIAVTTLRKIDLSKDGARGLHVLDNREQATATKRTRDPQQVDGFQNTGFATAVCAVEDIDTRGGGEGHRVQIAHPGDRDATKRHLGCAGHEVTDASA